MSWKRKEYYALTMGLLLVSVNIPVLMTIGKAFISDNNHFTIIHFLEVLFLNEDYLIRFWNSVFLTFPIVIIQTVITILSAYGLILMKGKLSRWILLSYSLAVLLPYQTTIIPNYFAVKQMGLLDTNAAILFPGFFSHFTLFILVKYISSADQNVMEAAQLDGAGQWKTLTHILIPPMKKIILICMMLVFADCWTMRELPLMMFSMPDLYPLSVFLGTADNSLQGVICAAAVIYLIPPLLLFLYEESV